ncbi:MAG: oligosaccharide flippase family protein [Candidatus Gastranaerophilales bacterium]|nr:oligosaccharide flippase family protein [Candidatus Gastranaerophilales bacterium]
MSIHKFVQKYHNMSQNVKAAFWYTFCNILQNGISVITVPIFTRIMSTEDYGIYSIYISWYTVFSVFTTLNLHYYVFNRGMVKYEDDRDGFVSSLQYLGVLSTTIVALVCYVLRGEITSLSGLSGTMFVLMFVELYTIAPMNYWMTRNRHEYKYKEVVIVTIAKTLSVPLLGILLIYIMEDDALARIISTVFITAILGLYFATGIIKKSPKPNIKKYWKYALSFNLPLLPHFLSTNILNQSDRIMISNMVGSSQAGIYSVAYSAGMILLIINTAINQTIVPWLYEKLKNRDYSNISRTFNFLLVIVFTVNIVLILFAREIIFIMAPADYYEAVWIIPPVAASVYFIFLYTLFSNLTYYFEDTKYVSFLSVIIAVLNVVLNYIFIGKFGYIAAGFTTLFCYICFSVCHYIVMRLLCKKHNFYEKIYDMKTIVALSSAMVILSLGIEFLYPYMFIRYLLILAIAVICIFNRKYIVRKFTDVRRKGAL